MEVDVVYKLNNSSKFNNKELRYSLRSLEKNFSGLRNVWIIGYLPEWINKAKVGYMNFPDTYGRMNKDANIITKLSVACTINDISYNFLQMSDDMIFIKKKNTEYFNTPLFNNNLLKPAHKYNDLKLFDQRVIKTVEVLRNNKFSQDVYEAHVPYLINKSYASVVMRFPFHDGIGYCGNSLFFNSLGYNGKQKESKTVLRLNQPSDSMENVMDYDFLNFNNFTESEELFSRLQEMFPDKSSFEL